MQNMHKGILFPRPLFSSAGLHTARGEWAKWLGCIKEKGAEWALRRRHKGRSIINVNAFSRCPFHQLLETPPTPNPHPHVLCPLQNVLIHSCETRNLSDARYSTKRILLSAPREAGDLTPSDPSSDLLSPGADHQANFCWTFPRASPRKFCLVCRSYIFIPEQTPKSWFFGSGSHRLHLSESDALASSSSRRSSGPDETVGTEPVAEGRRRQPRKYHHNPRNVFFLSRAHTHAGAGAVPVPPPPPRTVMQHRNPWAGRMKLVMLGFYLRWWIAMGIEAEREGRAVVSATESPREITLCCFFFFFVEDAFA